MKLIYIFIIATIIFAILLYRNSNKNLFVHKFSSQYLSLEQKNALIEKKLWREECPVDINRLKLLKISYFDFAGKEHNDGSIMVMDVVANNVIKIFKNLYELKFPINSLKLIDEYNGDDELSMKANNSYAFNCRSILGSDKWSIHAYGLAIDINPEQNPYLINRYEPGKLSVPVYPPQGMNYINRTKLKEGMVEPIVEIFRKNGFSIWGGSWGEPIDWHHFQLKREEAEAISKLDYKEGVKYFEEILASLRK
jgi:hypothetical protein